MSLKMNFLIISIWVLIIFVKMVPAPLEGETNNSESNDSTTANPEVHVTKKQKILSDITIPKRNPIVNGTFDDEALTNYPHKHIVHCDTLIDFNELYQTEIEKYCTQFNIIQTKIEEKRDISATLLYIKDTLYRYNTYHSTKNISANLLTQYLLMENNEDESDLKNEFTRFKEIKEDDMRNKYEIVTSCDLDETIEEKYFLKNFRNFYHLSNAKIINKPRRTVKELVDILKKEEKNDEHKLSYLENFKYFEFTSDTYLDFIKSSSEELKESRVLILEGEALKIYFDSIKEKFDPKEFNAVNIKKYLIDQYIIFTRYWKFYKFDLNAFLKYKILDKKKVSALDKECLDRIVDANNNNLLGKFLEHFKESLDDRYYIMTGMNIDEVLDNNKKNMYYTNTILTIRNIVASSNFTQIVSFFSASSFVQKLNDTAELIKNSDETKHMLAQLEKDYDSNTNVCSKKEAEKKEPGKELESGDENEKDPPAVDEKDLITVEDSYHICDDIKCDLPNTVNIQAVINYIIHELKVSEVQAT